MKLTKWKSIYKEDITIPLSVGDNFLYGKWKNKKGIVAKFSKNEKGEDVIITKDNKTVPLLKIRLVKEKTFYNRLFLESKKIKAYHGSNVPISRFDRNFSAQGVFWFSENKDKILKGNSGASSSKYIIEVILNVNKIAGWDEYEKLSLSEIEHLGYDSIKLDDDWVIFKNKNIKIISVEKIK